MSDQIGNKVEVKLPISSWWQVILILSTIMACYFGLKGTTEAARDQGQRNEEKMVRVEATVNQIVLDLALLKQKVEDSNKR